MEGPQVGVVSVSVREGSLGMGGSREHSGLAEDGLRNCSAGTAPCSESPRK